MIPTLRCLTWPSPACIFEIGACEGEDTVKYAREFPQARFWLFEPLPDNVAKIKSVLVENPQILASVSDVALSDSIGVATFHVSSAGYQEVGWSGNKSSSLLSPKNEKPKALQWLQFSDRIQVKTDTLDNFCQRESIKKIDFIHMDVQGAELKVLAGAQRMLWRTKAIWMEVAFEPTYEGQPLEPEATRWMAERGFRKIHQVNYGPEGDALYYNMRLPLSWPRFAALRLMQKFGLVAR